MKALWAHVNGLVYGQDEILDATYFYPGAYWQIKLRSGKIIHATGEVTVCYEKKE